MSDIDPAKVRILYDREVYLVLGPLGCFYKGQKLQLLDGREVEITSIDADGAGVARTAEYVEQARSLPPNWTTSYGIDWATPLSREGMIAQQERNRREYGVTLP